MQMSEEEIVKSYNGAKNKRTQIGILADLNACSKQDILDILKKHNSHGEKEKTTEKPTEEPTPSSEAKPAKKKRAAKSEINEQQYRNSVIDELGKRSNEMYEKWKTARKEAEDLKEAYLLAMQRAKVFELVYAELQETITAVREVGNNEKES